MAFHHLYKGQVFQGARGTYNAYIAAMIVSMCATSTDSWLGGFQLGTLSSSQLSSLPVATPGRALADERNSSLQVSY